MHDYEEAVSISMELQTNWKY